MSEMRELLKKDYRLSRSVLFLSASIVAVTYVGGAIIEIVSNWPKMLPPKAWADLLWVYGSIATFLMGFIGALFGGNAIACERTDRTAHFLLSVPVSRKKILLSKATVAIGALCFLWSVILLSLFVVAPLLYPIPMGIGRAIAAALGAGMCTLSFGVGWLGSARAGTVVPPVVVAVGTTIGVVAGAGVLGDTCGFSPEGTICFMSGSCFVLGSLAFFVGTQSYLRRVEP